MLRIEWSWQAVSGYKVKSMEAFSPVSKKTSATFTAPDGTNMMACKGAPQVTVMSGALSTFKLALQEGTTYAYR